MRILELDPIPGLLIIVLVNHLNLHFLSSLHDTDLVAVTEEGDEIRHAWYQWVVFVLFFQVLYSYLVTLTTVVNSGNPLLPPSLSLEELGGWKTFFTPPGTDLLDLNCNSKLTNQ